MKRLQSRATVLGAALAAVTLLAGGALVHAAQDGPPDAQALWQHLEEEDYQSWPSYAGAPDDLYEGQRPHGALLRTYANGPAAANPDDLPEGSIVVKENYTPQRELAAITVMQKSSGYDPANQDWFWVKYDPDGSVAQENGTELAGKVQSCIGCHASAAGDDYVYTNDR
ncbi:MAG: cytochrome P460 family protein [Thermoanaerobaculia bacterium]